MGNCERYEGPFDTPPTPHLPPLYHRDPAPGESIPLVSSLDHHRTRWQRIGARELACDLEVIRRLGVRSPLIPHMEAELAFLRAQLAEKYGSA